MISNETYRGRIVLSEYDLSLYLCLAPLNRALYSSRYMRLDRSAIQTMNLFPANSRDNKLSRYFSMLFIILLVFLDYWTILSPMEWERGFSRDGYVTPCVIRQKSTPDWTSLAFSLKKATFVIRFVMKDWRYAPLLLNEPIGNGRHRQVLQETGTSKEV